MPKQDLVMSFFLISIITFQKDEQQSEKPTSYISTTPILADHLHQPAEFPNQKKELSAINAVNINGA